jgi:hypothetical protein
MVGLCGRPAMRPSVSHGILRPISPGQRFGEKLALVVGIGLVGAAVAVVATGGAPILATILTLIGAGDLSGWARSCKKK